METITLTREMLLKLRTGKGGYNKRVLDELLGHHKPKQGWTDALIGTTMPLERWEHLVELRNTATAAYYAKRQMADPPLVTTDCQTQPITDAPKANTNWTLNGPATAKQVGMLAVLGVDDHIATAMTTRMASHIIGVLLKQKKQRL